VENFEAAHLAVADHVDARALLQGDHLVDRLVLEALEARGAEQPLLEGRSALLQVGRTQHRPDHLSAEHAPNLLPAAASLA
jgi:hypothetical protein